MRARFTIDIKLDDDDATLDVDELAEMLAANQTYFLVEIEDVSVEVYQEKNGTMKAELKDIDDD